METVSNAAIGLVIAIVVVVASIWLYNNVTGVMPGAKLVLAPPAGVQPSGVDENVAKFMFFYTTWCPHSRKAEGPWKSFQQILKNAPRKFGGMSLQFEDVNAETQTGKAALYGIKQYPTFKIQTKDSVYEFVGLPTVNNFRAALVDTFGQESG
jgi:thiol-disulfide isomerase/thioredoxin